MNKTYGNQKNTLVAKIQILQYDYNRNNRKKDKNTKEIEIHV